MAVPLKEHLQRFGIIESAAAKECDLALRLCDMAKRDAGEDAEV